MLLLLLLLLVIASASACCLGLLVMLRIEIIQTCILADCTLLLLHSPRIRLGNRLAVVVTTGAGRAPPRLIISITTIITTIRAMIKQLPRGLRRHMRRVSVR